jgi:membrane protease YdiL (CAAX protease family)
MLTLERATMPATTRTPRWAIGSTGAIFLTIGLVVAHFVVLFGLGGFIAKALHLNGRTIYAATPASFVMLIVTAALEVVLVFGFGMRGLGRLGFGDVGWKGLGARDAIFGVVGFLACGAVTLAVLVVLWKSPAAAVNHLVGSVSSFTAAQRIFFVLMGAFAAFGEETIFRGILQPTLQRKMGRWPGLVAAAIIFGVYHLKLRPVVLLSKVLTGFVLGGLRERTGTLWAPATAHALIWAVLGTT